MHHVESGPQAALLYELRFMQRRLPNALATVARSRTKFIRAMCDAAVSGIGGAIAVDKFPLDFSLVNW